MSGSRNTSMPCRRSTEPCSSACTASSCSAHPEAQADFAYAMPTYRVGKRRLNIGVWKHGVSVYGWRRDNDGGFAGRHPDLLSGKSTIRLRPTDADSISDKEFSGLLGGALDN